MEKQKPVCGTIVTSTRRDGANPVAVMFSTIGVARGAKGAIPPQMFRKYRHFEFERLFSKQNSVIRLNSNILVSPKLFAPQISWLATPLFSTVA